VLRSSFIAPCNPTFRDRLPKGEGWLFEITFDGYRLQVHKAGERAILSTRNGADWTYRFLRLAEELASLPCSSAILDAELVNRSSALPSSGASSALDVGCVWPASTTRLKSPKRSMSDVPGQSCRALPGSTSGQKSARFCRAGDHFEMSPFVGSGRTLRERNPDPGLPEFNDIDELDSLAQQPPGEAPPPSDRTELLSTIAGEGERDSTGEQGERDGEGRPTFTARRARCGARD
jgi:hypothetical protein